MPVNQDLMIVVVSRAHLPRKADKPFTGEVMRLASERVRYQIRFFLT